MEIFMIILLVIWLLICILIPVNIIIMSNKKDKEKRNWKEDE